MREDKPLPTLLTRGAASVTGFGFGGANVGQQAFTTPGTYTWVVPYGVTSVCVVCIGGGARGGGGLGWKNNIPVTPGESITVVVGAGSDKNGSPNGDSYFKSPSIVAGGRAVGGLGGGYTGDGGGNGGNAPTGVPNSWGGGGAGGYSGNGGDGGAYDNCGAAGSGGGGGGGGGGNIGSQYGTWTGGGGGGGTGILGQGASGGGGCPNDTSTGGGGGGSGGGDGGIGVDTAAGGFAGGGGSYGGGGGYGSGDGIAGGAGGAVRIIWGAGRAFPSTNTGNL